MKTRREYAIKPLTINSRNITKLIVDDHVDKHSDHINDELIKRLIKTLDNERFEPVKEVDGFQYFASAIKDNNKWYKLIWLLEENLLYIGVITAFRDKRIK
jgi:hypothetical protein